jgi:MFS transporter, PAT family, beta-lactamase induction signal transducer AmpG
MSKNSSRSPWVWIPTLYFAEGLPYVVAMTVSVIMFKRMGISNADIALYTSWLYLPWVIKPIWSPFVDIFRTKRFWIIVMQLLTGGTLAGVAFTLPGSDFFRWTLAFLWLLAFSSATHDIAADGFYMLGLSKHHQAFFVGIRNTFYRLAMLSGQGILVVLAGYLEEKTGAIARSWSLTFMVLALLFAAFFIYHLFILPRPKEDTERKAEGMKDVFYSFIDTFTSFFKKRHAALAIAFLLLYRLGEAQLVKLASPFLLDSRETGGLGLSTSDVGMVYGTAGIIALTVGGILGGIAVAQQGLRRWIWPLALALNLPNLVYVGLAFWQPVSLWWISAAVVVEQFGYGFGFTAYMLFMIYFSDGPNKTAHYAICTGFMALGMMVPGMFSGWIQEIIGYQWFFLWVVICTLPGFALIPFLKIDPAFGLKKNTGE